MKRRTGTPHDSRCPVSIVSPRRDRLARVLFVVAMAASLPVLAAGSPPPACLSDGIGAPACTSAPSPGSAVDPARPGRHVGNPIELTSGNKYQHELDYRDAGSGLAFDRHYNSLLTDEDRGLGPGWRHGYDVSLGRVSASRLRLTQSDGRRLEFDLVPRPDSVDAPSAKQSAERSSEPAAGRGVVSGERYEGSSAALGHIIHRDGLSSWYVGDGRRLDFHGPWLRTIDYGDSRGSLAIEYRGRRVASVRADDGASLLFHYVGRQEVLPRYGTDERYRPEGSLDSVSLPDGRRLQFDYAPTRQLEAVTYPDGTGVVYGYADPLEPSLLTSRRDGDGLREWHYDDGLAVSSSGAAGLRIERRALGDRAGEATLRWNDGRVEMFAWSAEPA